MTTEENGVEPVHLSAALRERMDRLASIPLSSTPRPESTTPTRRDLPQGVKPETTWDQVDQLLRNLLIDAVHGARRWPVFIFGGTGSGKTSAAACIYRDWRKSPELLGTARWWRMENLLSYILKARFNHEGIVTYLPSGDSVRVTEGGLFASFAQADLAVLDDVGAGEQNQQRTSVLLQLIDSRVGKPMLLTSNMDISEIELRYGDRIASRIVDGTIIHATGEDRRLRGT